MLNLIQAGSRWWGAQLFEPYVPEDGVRNPLSPDAAFLRGFRSRLQYPDQKCYRIFGVDYAAAAHAAHIGATYKMLKNHRVVWSRAS